MKNRSIKFHCAKKCNTLMENKSRKPFFKIEFLNKILFPKW